MLSHNRAWSKWGIWDQEAEQVCEALCSNFRPQFFVQSLDMILTHKQLCYIFLLACIGCCDLLTFSISSCSKAAAWISWSSVRRVRRSRAQFSRWDWDHSSRAFSCWDLTRLCSSARICLSRLMQPFLKAVCKLLSVQETANKVMEYKKKQL